MDRKDLKRIRELSTARPKITGSSASPQSIRESASKELAAVSDAYETASLAVDTIRALLANANYSQNPSREVATLLKALRDATAILTESREEARRTVADLQGRPEVGGTEAKASEGNVVRVDAIDGSSLDPPLSGSGEDD